MTGTQLAALIRFKTGGTNATTFPDTEMLPLVNIFKDEIASKIVEKDAGYFLVPTDFDLIASSTSREYKFPDDMLNRFKKLELKFSATESKKPATYLKDYKGSETESEIVANFGNAEGEFFYTIRRRAVFILSGTIIAVTLGGRFVYYSYPVDLANLSGVVDLSLDPSTTTFGFPIAFQELLARRVSIEWKSAQPKPIPLSRHEMNYENDLKLALDALSTVAEQGEVIGDEIPLYETGNNGHNY